MNDIERRLRAAMIAAAELWSAEHQSGWDPSGDCPPGRRGRSPAAGSAEHWMTGLLEGVRQRHRRHVRRMNAASVVAATAILLGVPPAGHALWAGLVSAGLPAAGPAAGVHRSAAESLPARSAGTALIGCAAESDGQLPANWRSASLRVGSLWLANARPQGYVHYSGYHGWTRAVAGTGKLRVGVMITEVAYGATVVMKVSPAARSYFRFQPAFSANGTGSYTIGAGATGLTFVACPRGTPPGVNGEVTDFYLGFLIKAGSRAPVSVWRSPVAKPAELLFTCPGLGCEGNQPQRIAGR